MEEFRILTAGDRAVTVEFGSSIDPAVNQKVTALYRLVSKKKVKGIVEAIPTFRSVTFFYEPAVISYEKLTDRLKKLAAGLKVEGTEKKRVFSIPVCYDEAYGPDMPAVMEHSGLDRDEVIALHSGRDYLIYMLGFLPGFAYLGGMDERLITPRLSSPRTKIEAGSVGIGGSQTGIYPLDSPGGWQLIGRTPVRPYDPNREEPILYKAGDYIRFVPVSAEEYAEIAMHCRAGNYRCQVTETEAGI